MLDAVIISNYWHFPSEKSSSRYHSIACMAKNCGISVEVITSRFYHTQKRCRNEANIDVPYKATLIEEGSYKKNVSVARILAHQRFAANVIKYLSGRKPPDVIYLFVPPAGLAEKVTRFSNERNIRVIIDVLDLWPEAFGMILPKAIATPLLYPMKHSVEYAYRNADAVIAVSDTYTRLAAQKNRKCRSGHSVFIGTDLHNFDAAAEGAQPLEGKLRPITMAYIGMLGHSYDLSSVMDAMELLRRQNVDEVELLVIGDGPLREKFEKYAQQLNLPVRFIGRLPYEEMVKKLVRCDIGINVLIGGSAATIINKHADYAAAGIPIINVQKNQEFGELLLSYNAGFSSMPGDTGSLAESIRKLAQDDVLRKKMGQNSRRLAEDKFDRNKTYSEIISIITGESE